MADAYVPPPGSQATDFVYRVVVLTIAVIAVGGLIGLIVLAAIGKTVPEAVVALSSAAVGAMAGLLAPSPVGDGGGRRTD